MVFLVNYMRNFMLLRVEKLHMEILWNYHVWENFIRKEEAIGKFQFSCISYDFFSYEVCWVRFWAFFFSVGSGVDLSAGVK